jgi:uncharacterized protein YggT (Ycf19 family)
LGIFSTIILFTACSIVLIIGAYVVYSIIYDIINSMLSATPENNIDSMACVDYVQMPDGNVRID